MITVGAFEAKTHFSELLGRVIDGETITITKYGIPAAMLVPIQETKRKLTHQEVIQGMQALRRRVRPDTMTLREMVEEGRRS